MPKTVRFSDVVALSGRPETESLWIEPNKDPRLRKAMREDRLMTVHTENVGSKKDYATIGFSEQKHSTYLIFPKSLRQFEGMKVVGIKYDLIEEPIPKDPARVRTSGSATPNPEPKPIRKKHFKVIIEQTFKIKRVSEVDAPTKAVAKDLAFEEIHSEEPNLSNVAATEKVLSVAEN
jgi:hypothetical protein